MHEMSLVRSAVDAVLEECAGNGVSRVTKVNLAVGEMRDVVDRYVPDLFRYLARGTVAQNAQVVVRRVPLTVRCGCCGDIFEFVGDGPDTRTCPRCGAVGNYKVFSGVEFMIESIEVVGEVPADNPNLVAVA